MIRIKRFFSTIVSVALLLSLFGCQAQTLPADIAATTLPVYQFTALLCQGTPLRVTRLVTESVSCLHDYSLRVSQVKAVEQASLVVISGAGLEDFMADLLTGRDVLDASDGISLLDGGHTHEHEHEHEASHADAHIWLSPQNALQMAQNICVGLSARYPQYSARFCENMELLRAQFAQLDDYAAERLRDLSCRELITFHDGFSYLAQSFDLHILAAVEEESGAEASAGELIELIELTRAHALPAIFTETNGADSAAAILSRETGAAVYTLDMAMSGEDYFAAMYHNINTLWEALS